MIHINGLGIFCFNWLIEKFLIDMIKQNIIFYFFSGNLWCQSGFHNCCLTKTLIMIKYMIMRVQVPHQFNGVNMST